MPSKSQKTKRYIIEKCAPIFNKKGYAGTSISDITRASGLTKGSIYGNFENKDDIATEAFKFNLQQLILNFEYDIEKAETAIEKLFAFTGVYRRIYKQVFLNGGCPILNTSTEADDGHQWLKILAKKGMLKLKDTFKKIIIYGINNGEIKNEINPDELSAVVISIIQGSIVVSRISDNEDYFLCGLDHINNIINSIQK